MTKRDSKGRFTDSLTTATNAMIGSTQPGISYKYTSPTLNFQSYYDCYDASPLAQLLINTLPEDTVSEWREWQADDSQVNAIEQEERRIDARKLIRNLQVYASIEGEAIIYLDDGTDATQPLDTSRTGRNGLRFARVFRRQHYTYGNLITDPMSVWYDQPEYYQITTDAAYISPMIHPSRVIRMLNNPSPQRETGMPALASGMESIKQYEAVIANAAFLVQKARTTIMKVDGLMDNVGDPVTEQQIIARYQLFKFQEGNQGMGVIDKEKEDWASHSYQFGGLDPIIQRMQQHVAAMWGYPVTRIFDRVDGGLGNNGDSSLKAYYQTVTRIQDNKIGPLIRPLDEMIVRSALGNYPEEIYYNWRPLEQPNQKEIQDIGAVAANTLNTAVAGGFLSAEVAEKAFINRTSETGCFPGIEAAYDEWVAAGGELEPDEGDVITTGEGDLPDKSARGVISDAAPRTLYVKRNVLNGDEVLQWAREQGFTNTLDKDDLHVTIAYSRKPIDWMLIGESWQSKIELDAGGPRLMEEFGDAKVLLFRASELEWRHTAIREAGASWDHSSYQPHITISYADMPENVDPYKGKIVLGPEVFDEVDDDWTSGIKSDTLTP